MGQGRSQKNGLARVENASIHDSLRNDIGAQRVEHIGIGKPPMGRSRYLLEDSRFRIRSRARTNRQTAFDLEEQGLGGIAVFATHH